MRTKWRGLTFIASAKAPVHVEWRPRDGGTIPAGGFVLPWPTTPHGMAQIRRRTATPVKRLSGGISQISLCFVNDGCD